MMVVMKLMIIVADGDSNYCINADGGANADAAGEDPGEKEAPYPDTVIVSRALPPIEID